MSRRTKKCAVDAAKTATDVVEDGEITPQGSSGGAAQVASISAASNQIRAPGDREAANVLDLEENGDDDDIEQIMRQIPNDNGDQDDLDLDPEVEQMLADLEKTDEFGECVSNITARTFKSINQLTITKELSDKWKADLKTPENCKEIVVPAVNAPIWSGLPIMARTNDVKMQSLQQNIVRAQISQMMVMEQMLAHVPKAIMQLILKPLLDGAKCLYAAMQEINQRRRTQLKPFLKTEYSGLNSMKVPVTSNLYGDDLEKTMKEAKTTASILKSNGGFQGSRPRFHPYRQHSRTAPLNYNRPSQMSGRGGQQFRGQRPQFNRNRQGFSRQQGQTYQFQRRM